MKLRWTTRAAEDLVAIQRYIAADKPQAGRTWVEKLRRRARLAAEAPLAGRIVPEIGRPDIREVLQGAYRLVYRVHDDAIVVLTVFEGHRSLPKQDLADP